MADHAMMYVQYSFIDRREPTDFAKPPIKLTPALAVCAGILAMLASVIVVALA
jgi:hypothetical protein